MFSFRFLRFSVNLKEHWTLIWVKKRNLLHFTASVLNTRIESKYYFGGLYFFQFFQQSVFEQRLALLLQSIPDNSNLQGKMKKVQVTGI